MIMNYILSPGRIVRRQKWNMQDMCEWSRFFCTEVLRTRFAVIAGRASFVLARRHWIHTEIEDGSKEKRAIWRRLRNTHRAKGAERTSGAEITTRFEPLQLCNVISPATAIGSVAFNSNSSKWLTVSLCALPMECLLVFFPHWPFRNPFRIDVLPMGVRFPCACVCMS